MIRLITHTAKINNLCRSFQIPIQRNKYSYLVRSNNNVFSFSLCNKDTNLNSNPTITGKRKKYILSQFPYPSGQLHLGHARVYYIGDTLSRYYKLHSQNVIYPIGFDSFGLPAQNAAIQHKKSSKTWTQTNIQQMKLQLASLEINFDWPRELATHTPQYYKWTQYIFLEMFKRGLAYKAESEVNWDPVDGTVLANQQVDNLGRSWRSGAIVEKKMLSQWFLGITKYAKELQTGLHNLGWIQKVKAMQSGWIGYRDGYVGKFNVQWSQNNPNLQEHQHINQKLKQKGQMSKKQIQIFINNLQDLLQQKSIVRYNIQNKSQQYNQNQTQKQKQKQKAQHNKTKKKQKQLILGHVMIQLNNGTFKKIPIVVGNEQNGLVYELVSAKEEEKQRQKATLQKIKQKVKVDSLGLKQSTAMRLKDWSISRQRYWGTPIPIIYCKNCGIVPVPQSSLPVPLPQWHPTSKTNPLLSSEFKSCQCPTCKQPATRQTDTMDTFVDSSWYYLRFLDNLNQKKLCRREFAQYWMPVDIYIGGIQHAIMHLLYARFVMRVLVDLGVCGVKEPFAELVVQGLVKGRAIRHKLTGKYLKPSQVADYKPEQLQYSYEKMSKSKFNGLNPQTLVEKYGPDALRIALFFAAPPQHDVDFHQDLLVSADRFLKRVQQFFKSLNPTPTKYSPIPADQLAGTLSTLKLQLNSQQQSNHNETNSSSNPIHNIKKLIQKLQQAMQKRYMHVYVANVMELFNLLKGMGEGTGKESKDLKIVVDCVFVPVLAIVAPRTVKKLYQGGVGDEGHKLAWPKSSYFPNFKQYLIMKGKKLIKKGVIALQSHSSQASSIQQQQDLQNQRNDHKKQQKSKKTRSSKSNQLIQKQIREKLQLEQSTNIKINKNNIVILIK